MFEEFKKNEMTANVFLEIRVHFTGQEKEAPL
jgi:hypothetical protein